MPNSRAGITPNQQQVEVVGLLRAQEPQGLFTGRNDPEKRLWVWEDVNAMALHAGGEQRGVQPVYVETIFGEYLQINQTRRSFLDSMNCLLRWIVKRSGADALGRHPSRSIASGLNMEPAATLWRFIVSRSIRALVKMLNTLPSTELGLVSLLGLSSSGVDIGEGHGLVIREGSIKMFVLCFAYTSGVFVRSIVCLNVISYSSWSGITRLVFLPQCSNPERRSL